jgi:hypothetical protein
MFNVYSPKLCLFPLFVNNISFFFEKIDALLVLSTDDDHLKNEDANTYFMRTQQKLYANSESLNVNTLAS